MKNTEKRNLLQALKASDSFSESRYYEVLEKIGDMKYNYGDYMITEPIDCNKELERLPEADYDLCCALLTMLLRAGEVQPILDRMITLLPDGE